MQTDFETMRLLHDRGLATVTLCRAENGNAVAAQFGRDFRAAALYCQNTPGVRAVLLNAEGKAFCVGGDLKAFAAMANLGPTVKDMTEDFHAGVSMLARMNAPLVVAVQGATAGAGLSMACLGDIVIAGRAAHFSCAYPGVGFSADGGLTWLLPRLVGLRQFQRLYYLGARVSAEEALALGIVTEVVEDEALGGRALAVARQLAEGPTQAYGATRRLTLDTFGQSLETHLEQESGQISRLAAGADARGAIAAVAQRQRPTFSGKA